MHTTWTQTTVAVARPHAEAVGSFLLDLGSPGLMTEDDERTVTLTAYFPPDATAQLVALRGLCEELAATAPELPPARIETRTLPQQDWAHNWMDHFPPIAVGERLYVVPPWVTAVPSDRIAVVIDPGSAFGTGHHATTQGCLTMLEQIVTVNPVRRALDVGTGSGILAIALAKLGVGEVWAVDIDPEARRAARENSERNGVAEPIHVVDQLAAAPGRFDLIVANLLSSLLIDLAPHLAELLKPDGHLVVSGVLGNEVETVVAAFAAQHLGESTQLIAGEWATLAFTARSL